MKVYVAAKFEEVELVRSIYKALEAAGHRITHDWTKEFDKPMPTDLHSVRVAAEDDLRGVKQADVVVVCPHGRGKGLFFELGAAAALQRPVIVYSQRPSDEKFEDTIARKDGHECIFLYLRSCVHAFSIEEIVRLVSWEVHRFAISGED